MTLPIGLGVVSVMAAPFLPSWLRLATFSSAGLGAARSHSIVRNIPYAKFDKLRRNAIVSPYREKIHEKDGRHCSYFCWSCNTVRGSSFASSVAREQSFTVPRQCLCPCGATANAVERSRRSPESGAALCSGRDLLPPLLSVQSTVW
jgi:hypothetical protein